MQYTSACGLLIHNAVERSDFQVNNQLSRGETIVSDNEAPFQAKENGQNKIVAYHRQSSRLLHIVSALGTTRTRSNRIRRLLYILVFSVFSRFISLYSLLTPITPNIMPTIHRDFCSAMMDITPNTVPRESKATTIVKM